MLFTIFLRCNSKTVDFITQIIYTNTVLYEEFTAVISSFTKYFFVFERSFLLEWGRSLFIYSTKIGHNDGPHGQVGRKENR